MKKPSKKWFALVAVAGVSICISGIPKANASEVVYDDSNISITAAVDRYIATNDNAVASLIDGYEEPEVADSETDIVASIDDSADVVNDESSNKVATGTVRVSNVTGEVTVVDPNSSEAEEQVEEQNAEEEPPVEETTEAPVESPSDSTAADDFVYALAQPDMTGKAVVTTSSSANIRKSGDINSERVGNIASGGIVTVKEKGSEWSLVTSGNVTGYIKNSLLAFDSDAVTYAANNLKQVVRVTASSLKVRSAANENSECLTLISEGTVYGIEEIGSGWTKIQVDDAVSGYVRNDYIVLDYTGPVAQVVNDTPSNIDSSSSTTESPGTTESSGITTAPSTNIGQDIANYAVQFVGNPYVYGGTSLTNGADCSGFVMTIYKNFGYSIPRTADVQGTVGTEVALSAVAPGDLVFYDHGTGRIKHVAMYIGDGKVVHASSSRTGIIISNMYYNTPCKAVRIVN